MSTGFSKKDVLSYVTCDDSAIPLIGTCLFFTRNRSIKIPLSLALLFLFGSSRAEECFWGTPLTYRIPLYGPFVPTFRVDPLSAIL